MPEPRSNIRLVHAHCGINKPTQAELETIKPQQFVKFIDNNERLWAQVITIDGEDLTARVDNDLVNDHTFACGDVIQLKKSDVIEIYVG